MGKLDPGTGRDGNAGDGNAFQQQLATIFADETIARISKGKWHMTTRNCAPRLWSRRVARQGVLEIPPLSARDSSLTATGLFAMSYAGTVVGDCGILLFFFSILLLGLGEEY